MRLSNEDALNKKAVAERLLRLFGNGESVQRWLSRKGEAWETYEEFTMMISEEFDPDLWTHVLTAEQRSAFVDFRTRLSDFDAQVCNFTREISIGREFVELRRLALDVAAKLVAA